MKAPLKTVLKNFLDHVDDLEMRMKVFDDQYESEFQELKKLTDKLKEDPAYPCSFGLKDVNRPKNRYKDIVPYDFSRVILPKHEGIPGSDYINASYIKGASGAFAYIAAQGPLPNTVIDFWRMIWICDVQVVVMACNEKEAGKFKCEVYWPGPGEIKQYGNISIEMVKTAQICPDFMVRTFLVKYDSEMRDVYQFHYTSWPDHGVPETVQPILDLVRIMRDCQASETVPIVVHCSAGCGRTGTICAVDYVWACLRHGKLDEDFSLYQIALELRRQRIAMIQTKEQYILAHKAVAAMFEQQLKVIDCHIYENIDEVGEPLVWKELGRDKELHFPDIIKKPNTKEKRELTLSDINELPVQFKRKSKLLITPDNPEKTQESSIDGISHNSSVDNNLNMKVNALDCANSSSKNSESSYSRNSILSQHSTEDSIPFIDDDEVCVRPNCGRAYLDIPTCNSITKLINCFDPFVDKVSLGTDDSSPDGDPVEMCNKMKDFQLVSSKTLDKNAKISSFKDSENKQIDNKSDIIDCSDKAKKSFFSYRESYPPCTNSENFQKSFPNAVESEVCESAKKIGKATVVRRPSISKLKALFEKSSVSSQKGTNGSKRLLFRHNSHHVSRAGSAPPSLDCMDKSSAVEKESILKIVTRKFRSSSVRTERELQSKQNEKTLNRRSATETVKDGFNALTRTMSFSLNKTFKSYSPSKIKPESSYKSVASNPGDSIVGIYKPKSPDSQKGNSMWYDKTSLPRAVAIVKPTGKFESDNAPKPYPKSPSDQKSPDKNKSETNFNYITKPAKLKDFFSSLNKKDAKDATALWYNESNSNTQEYPEKIIPDISSKPENTNSSTKSTSKVLPFLQMSPWKKVGQKSPLSSPDSPKSLNEPMTPQNSKFYADVLEIDTKAMNLPTEKDAKAVNSPVEKDTKAVSSPTEKDTKAVNSPTEKDTSTEVPKCPIPEEIIPLIVDPMDKFWPSNFLPCDSEESIMSENNSDSYISACKDIPQQSVNTELVKNESVKTNVNDMPPAIPKKMVIGKNKTLQNAIFDKSAEPQNTPLHQTTNDNIDASNTEIKPLVEEVSSTNSSIEKNDLYINVNIKAMKNIEQIENVLRKNPRGAIIDLTSRESYSMEEELVNAVNQLSESSDKNKVPSISSEHLVKSKAFRDKSNSKFPGYEVIWPEQPIPIQKSSSGSKVPLTNENKLTDKNSDDLNVSQNKTGLCHSPPLRRSVNASLALAKSQSCGNLDWLEPDDLSLKEPSNTPTKRLVNEAVVELNTLLNQLTTRTLSEDVDFNSKSKEKLLINEEANKRTNKSKVCDVEQNDTVVHSVTLVTKSYAGSSPKEEEIVFHFPPPPRIPPPKDESPSESFEIVCKGGSLKVKEATNFDEMSKSLNTNKESLVTKNVSETTPSTSLQMFPQPAPRKSKQTGDLKRSSSYSNIGPLQGKNKGYENVFLEKYQTLSRLEIKPEYGKHNILDKVVPFQKSPIMPKASNAKNAGYVNIGDVRGASVLNANNMKPPVAEKNESIKNKESISHTINASKNQASFGSVKMIVDENENGHSVYGKIHKLSDAKSQITENSGTAKTTDIMHEFGEVKKKPVHSKKTERAPLPPNIKPVQAISNEMILKLSPNNSMIPKKLPSRKLEKAPPPPLVLQKSSSAMIVPKKNVQNPQAFLNFPSTHQIEDKHKLPAVRENVPNVADNSRPVSKKMNTPVTSDKFVNRGLSHSQSDVSVYLALKERRIQSANQQRKFLNMKSLFLDKKAKNDPVNVSSSDSDSSYERIFLTKNDESSKTSSKYVPKEQIEQVTTRTYKKEVPVAPPRSKRRSTMEVQYTQVKAKDASRVSSTSLLLGDSETRNSKSSSSASEDDPPAIPMKTKDAFEIPEKGIATDMNKRTDEIDDKTTANLNPSK